MKQMDELRAQWGIVYPFEDGFVATGGTDDQTE
jgi:hypothetical protein